MWNLTATIPFVVLDLWSLFCNSPSRMRANSRCGAINRAYPFGSGQSAVLAGCVCATRRSCSKPLHRGNHRNLSASISTFTHMRIYCVAVTYVGLGLVALVLGGRVLHTEGQSSSCRGGRCLRNRGYRLGICSDRVYYRRSYLDLGKSEYFRITTDLSTTRKNRAP
jgi:hypothetical protein